MEDFGSLRRQRSIGSSVAVDLNLRIVVGFRENHVRRVNCLESRKVG